ncbi:hypothetical protein Clacol_010408 [Clathrus columnatus]|uniref:Uncharacterized protein n=1 Tax=Clathrus columnatus TaxID=1419009 RepID=A0AAV5ARI0_9AGAM|nr:hypothetical protein Clacol_010408 [Clathrus columnatus]
MTDTPNNNSNEKSKPKSRENSSFEAKLRGKLKRGFNNLTFEDPPPQPAASSSAAAATTDPPIQPRDDVPMQDAQDPPPQPQSQPQQQSNPRSHLNGVDLDEFVGDYDSDAYDVEPEDDDEGEPADSEGYHRYTKTYRDSQGVVKFLTAIVHNPDDPKWLSKVMGPKKPAGIYSPEGYIWGRTRKEVFYMELMPGMRKSGSLSIVYALDKKRLAFHKVKEDGSRELEPDFEESCDNPEVLKICCGEPRPHHNILYNTDPYMLEMAGPDRLDTYIPPSDLPRWLYVYDEDEITLSSPSELRSTKGVNWITGTGHPVLPIPPDTKPHKYRLVDPTGINVSPDEEPVDPKKNHATLILSKSRTIHGSRLEYYEAQISLQGRGYPSRLRVTAKLTDRHRPERLENEATMYNLFPDYFSREYTGVQLVQPSVIPRRLSKVVPSFYGYYEHVPEEVVNVKGKGEDSENANTALEDHEDTNEEQENENENDPIIPSRRSILLTEYCGSWITPEELTQYQKLEIVSLLDRFHNAGFILGSVSSWHFRCQPGPPERFEPLCRTPAFSRTSEKPSFRIESFGVARWCGLNSERSRVASEHHREIRDIIADEKDVLYKAILLRRF